MGPLFTTGFFGGAHFDTNHVDFGGEGPCTTTSVATAAIQHLAMEDRFMDLFGQGSLNYLFWNGSNNANVWYTPED